MNWTMFAIGFLAVVAILNVCYAAYNSKQAIKCDETSCLKRLILVQIDLQIGLASGLAALIIHYGGIN